MKNCFYILILLLSFSCKKEENQTKGNISITKDSIKNKDSINPWKIKNPDVIDVFEELSEVEKDSLINHFFTQDSIYKWVKPEEFSKLDRRTVKAKSGLNIRDSLGNKIGKLEFGENIYILEYSKDTKEINDNGKKIKGRVAKIVTKWSDERIKVKENHYKHNWYVTKKNIGYVFEGFLYENNQDGNDYSLYKYGYLVIGEKGEDSKIDLRELLEVKKIDFKKYKNLVIESPEGSTVEGLKKINKTIVLPFENGKKLVLKDSTYNSEYNPTRSYSVFHHKDFPDNYMVTESMFFMPDIHTELSIKTGDTLNKFNGYPYISANKNYAVTVTHDLTECYHDTYFEAFKKDSKGTYKRLFSFNPESWSYPFKKNDKGSMDDIFTINWLNDNEFIIKVVDYIDDCYEPDQLSKPYYLKFKIKI